MQSIIIATVAVAVIGLLIGVLLVIVGNKFKVETDPREAAVREFLPGNNCGGCGYAGCDAMAAAIVAGEAPVNGCPVGGDAVGEQIANIMGVEAEEGEKKVAFVKCSGDCSHAVPKCNYIGIKDCASAIGSSLNPWKCDFGCLGFGSCAAACPFDAIHVIDGVARVDASKCKACGKCIAKCPHHLIELAPYEQQTFVGCSSTAKGKAVTTACEIGCIGCKKCEKTCPNGAITVTDFCAHIDYDKCTNCGACKEACPRHVIL